MGLLRRIEGGYVPADEEAAQWALKDKPGDIRRFKLIKERNPLFNAKFNAMVDLVAANQDRIQFSTKKQGNERLKYAACYMLKQGDFWGKNNEHFTRKSFAFGNMDEEEFEEIYNQFLDLYLKHFVPMEKEDFRRELEGFG